jgi:hypothetical protein
VEAAQAPVLTWLPGQLAFKHHLYFSDSSEAVTQGAASADKGELAGATFTPGTLESLTTYYWRADEILAVEGVKAGPVWRFTTCLPIDDFESYTDKPGETIYDAWIDGVTNGLTGSMVGYGQAPFAEQKIVHGGLQSMPFDYNNTRQPYYSEAELDFAPGQDWTAEGAGALVLYLRGRAGNAPAQLYVAVEDASQHVAVVAYPDKDIVKAPQWTQWKVLLSSFTGVNMAKVKVLYIGFGDRQASAAGGAGLVFIDDICLTRP